MDHELKYKTLKLSEKSLKENLQDLGLGKFLDFTPKSLKEKNGWIGFYQSENFYFAKDLVKRMEWQVIISLIYLQVI